MSLHRPFGRFRWQFPYGVGDMTVEETGNALAAALARPREHHMSKGQRKLGITHGFDDSTIAAWSRIVSFRFKPGGVFP
jgi:hypothetical protein